MCDMKSLHLCNFFWLLTTFSWFSIFNFVHNLCDCIRQYCISNRSSVQRLCTARPLPPDHHSHYDAYCVLHHTEVHCDVNCEFSYFAHFWYMAVHCPIQDHCNFTAGKVGEQEMHTVILSEDQNSALQLYNV